MSLQSFIQYSKGEVCKAHALTSFKRDIQLKPERSGEQLRLKPFPNNFVNNGAASQALIRCTDVYCFKNNHPPITSCILRHCSFRLICISILQDIWKLAEGFKRRHTAYNFVLEFKRRHDVYMNMHQILNWQQIWHTSTNWTNRFALKRQQTQTQTYFQYHLNHFYSTVLLSRLGISLN